MLEEAVEIIRALWTGDTVDHRGVHYEVENARLFDPPADPPPIIVSGFGDDAVRLAARIGDGYWGHSRIATSSTSTARAAVPDLAQAAEFVREDDAAGSVPCGPHVEGVLDSVRLFLAAGYDHL